MYGRQELINKVKSYDPNANLELINKALDVAFECHSSQLRASGEPYIVHPIAVAQMIADMNLDTASVVTALLHDTVEDTDLTLENVEQDFGKDIANLVDGVTKLTRLESQPEHIRQAENFCKLLLATSEDIRVLLIKLADRLHNMRTIDYINSVSKKQRIALETMEIYAPLAERIGIHQYKTELQDISFKILHPEIRGSILDRLNEIAQNGQELIGEIIVEIQQHIASSGLQANVSGRQKTPYSIWMKMNQKNVSFDQLSDIIAFRIIVRTLPECYEALGIIHSKYKMVPANFQDFISTPKNNGYQSIHTVVIGPLQQRIEVQIRTEEMHEVAELGVAAHWIYKQKHAFPHSKQYRWIQELMHLLDDTQNSVEFLQNTKLEMYYDQVFCFTPQGRLIPLPKGATPVDFAYAVHSEVGHHCSRVKINGQPSSLRTELKNGDQVEIITSPSQSPVPSWEEFIITGKARSEVRKFIRQQHWQQYVRLGQGILEKSIKNIHAAETRQKLLIGAKVLNKKSLDELYFAVGEGSINRIEVINLLNPINAGSTDSLAIPDIKKIGKDNNTMSIKGLVPGIIIHYAGCCRPIPGDEIVGIIYTGKGIIIHTADCEYLENLDQREFDPIPLSWEGGSELYQSFIARFQAILVNQPGSLAVFTTEFAKNKSNINNFKVVNRSVDLFEVLVDAEVQNTEHLQSIISSLKTKKEVNSIQRLKS